MSENLLISDAAKMVQVESHVLRYWEEELQLPIHRNDLGHRYYTQEDVDRFKQIKNLKERGLQLKAIKMIMRNGKFDMLEPESVNNTSGEVAECQTECSSEKSTTIQKEAESREEKAQRLQWIMQQLIREAVQENNEELVAQIRESVVKELDYQFRMKEEKEEERYKKEVERTESYYQKMDELLREKAPQKKKRHFIF